MSDETDISVCNYSLRLLGLPRIESFEEGSDAAEVCADIYPKKRDAILADFNWRPNIKKRQLAKIADAKPLNEWNNIHALPANMLEGPSAVFGDGADTPSAAWEIYENKLYSNFETVIIDYLGRADESEFSALLIDFLAHACAAAMAMPLTESADKADYLTRIAYGPPQLDGNGGLYLRAKRAVAQNKPIQSIHQNGNPLTSTRF